MCIVFDSFRRGGFTIVRWNNGRSIQGFFLVTKYSFVRILLFFFLTSASTFECRHTIIRLLFLFHNNTITTCFFLDAGPFLQDRQELLNGHVRFRFWLVGLKRHDLSCHLHEMGITQSTTDEPPPGRCFGQ